jgi:uncharacterized protein YpuA (DUF1002 family)
MFTAHKKALWLTGAAAVLVAGVVYAADASFDEAIANANKAVALVKAGEIPQSKTSKLAERHRRRAIAALERAKDRIECAKQAADGHKVILCKDKDD